jgi:glycosyltransferase involved in cell wall biosynthesis
MRVLYFGFFDPSYPRNAVLRHGLRTSGVEVIECNVPRHLWPGSAGVSEGDERGRSRLRRELSEVLATGRRAWHLWKTASRLQAIDAVVVAEFNHGIVPLASLVARRLGAPLIVDVLLSLYDEGVRHRGLLTPGRPRAIYRRQADRWAIRLADCVLADTREHVEFFESEFGGVRRKARVLPIGFPDWEIQTTPMPERGRRPYVVLFYGYFHPIHGLEHVISAAEQLAGDGRFEFRLVGRGQMFDKIAAAARDASPRARISLRPPVHPSELSDLIASADICLGVFGRVGLGERTLPNKVWQCLGAGRPVVTRSGLASSRILRDGEHCLLVPPGDPGAIAEALRRLANSQDLASALAKSGADMVRQSYSSARIGAQLAHTIGALSAKKRGDYGDGP